MKANRWIVFLFSGLVLTLAACAGQAGVLDIHVAEATRPSEITAGLDQLEPLALAFLSGISEDRVMFVAYQDTTCAASDEAGEGPFCYHGEKAGDPLRVFPVGGSQRSFLRPEEIGQILDWAGEDLAAVFRPATGGQPASYWPEGELALLFKRTELGQPGSMVAVTAKGLLVRLDVFPGLTTDQFLKTIPLDRLVLTPAEAQAWSARLKQLQVQTQVAFQPGEQWNAQTMIALPPEGGDQYFHWMAVSNESGTVRWQVAGEWAPYGAGYTVPLPLVWSQLSPVLYWTYTLTPEGCVVFSNASDLHRLDLTTGLSTQLLEPSGMWLALSPDETRVAAAGGEELLIHDLQTGEERRASLPSGQPGQIVWSPDGKTLALTIAENACGDPSLAAFSILKVDPQTMAVATLIDRDPRRFSTQSWPEAGSVLVADRDGSLWRMDPQTGEVQQEVAPTGGSTAIFGWVSRADLGAAPENLLAGIIVRLGAGACPSVGLAETATIATDISYSFTSLPAGTYCVSIDPAEPANQAVLPPGHWVLPVRTEGIVQSTIVLAEGETRYNTDFTWMPEAP